MRIEYINPFVNAAFDIIKEAVTSEVTRGDLSLRPSLSPVLGVAIIIGLAGQVKGRVLIDMSKETGLKIASVMNKEELTEFDELTTATLSELANMIVGKAVTVLHEKGFQFDLTPPAMLIGDNIRISNRELESLVVPIILPQGEIEINVALKEEKV